MTMSETKHTSEGTAVDDIRRVREKIAREHGDDFGRHIAETNRIAEAAHAQLGIKIVPPPVSRCNRARAGG